MNINSKLKGIFSVSAASLALLQSTDPAKAKELGITSGVSGKLQSQSSVQSDKLILAPSVSTDELSKRLAAHRSHASHSSHRSHYSSYGTGVGRSNPDSPVIPPSPPIQRVQPVPVPVPVPPTPLLPEQPEQSDVTRKVVAFQKKQAAAGVPVSQYDLGTRYLTGDGVEKDAVNAKTLLEMSASQQYSPAIDKLKELGISTTITNATNTVATPLPPEQKSTAILFKEATEGSASSQYELGLRYIVETQIEQNKQKAKLFLELSAIQGNAAAATKLEEVNAAAKAVSK